MGKSNELIRVFFGSEVKANLLKGELEKRGIAAMIKNEFRSGVAAGFGGGLVGQADVYIKKSDIDEAQPLLDDFKKDLTNDESQ